MDSNELKPAWRRRDGVLGCKRFMTQKCYEAQSAAMQANYEPFCCAGCDTMRQRLEAAERDALVGAVVWRFIDRMTDVCPDCDPAERILAEFVDAVRPAIDAAMVQRVKP